MYRALFPDITTSITWRVYVEEPGMRCPLVEFMERLPDKRRGKVKARMVAWAQANNWMIVNPEIMHRLKDTAPPVYELKCFQERVLFIRCGTTRGRVHRIHEERQLEQEGANRTRCFLEACRCGGCRVQEAQDMKKNKMSVAERRAFVEELAVTSVALAIAEAIQNSGMSQREVAKRLGVSEARISQILAATGNPTIKTLARLADVLERELRVEFSSNVHVPGQGVEWRVSEGAWNGSASSEDDSSEGEQYVTIAA